MVDTSAVWGRSVELSHVHPSVRVGRGCPGCHGQRGVLSARTWSTVTTQHSAPTPTATASTLRGSCAAFLDY